MNQVEQEEAGAEEMMQVGWGGIIGDCGAVDDIMANVGLKPMEVYMRGEKERDEQRGREREGGTEGERQRVESVSLMDFVFCRLAEG